MKKSTLGIISGVIGTISGLIIGEKVCYSFSDKIMQQNVKRVDKFKIYYEVLNQWLKLKQEGKQIDQFFLQNNIKTITVYGMGEVGNRLVKELENSQIVVKYCLDKEAVCVDSNENVISIEDDLEPVDMVVVTAMFAFDEIEELLSEKFDCPIISLDEVIFGIQQ